jgi:hypothetical protein
MAADDKWERWNEYQNTGKFPKTSRQQRDAIGKNKRAREFFEAHGGKPDLSWIAELKNPNKPGEEPLF